MSGKRIIFVHGLGPKPPARRLLRQWRQALARSLWTEIPEAATAIAYWADLRDGPALAGDGDAEACRRIRRRLRARSRRRGLRRPLDVLRGAAFRLYLRLLRRAGPFIDRLERQLARDYYLYFHRARAAVRARLEEEMRRACRPGRAVAVVAHSMGTVIAYDAILHNPHLPVDLLVTMGSPLGLAAVQEELCAGAGGGLPFPANLRRWLNVFDGLDPVTLPDQRLAEDFTLGGARLICDRMVRPNHGPGGERDPHHWFGYLTAPEVGDAVSQFWLAP